MEEGLGQADPHRSQWGGQWKSLEDLKEPVTSWEYPCQRFNLPEPRFLHL